MTKSISKITPLQMEILEMTSFVDSPEMIAQMKKAISSFFAQVAEEEVNRLWETGELTDEKVESFRSLHQRTAYK